MSSILGLGNATCGCGQERHQTKLIVVTGGPGAGKTAILEMAKRALCEHVAVLPEAASIVFGGGFPRHSSVPGQRASQRAIYYTQRELENLVCDEGEVAIALCDRGTVDGGAYWPEGSTTLWQQVGTTLQAELDRYSAVIHLETPTAEEGYNHSNRLRTESPLEAKARDLQIMAAWQGHANRLSISSSDDFVAKATKALAAIQEALPRCCAAHRLSPGSMKEADSCQQS